MIMHRSASRSLAIATLLILGGCVGGLLGGGKPDALYRFGNSLPVDSIAVQSSAQRTLLLQRIGFASEIDGDRILAVHGGSALYIKGIRWVTAAPSLFTQAVLRSFEVRAPAIRISTTQSGDVTGHALALNISRFDVQYEDAAMVASPAIVIEGDATLYGLSDRKIVSKKHFSMRDSARQNRADEIVAAFDRASSRFTAEVAEWVQMSTANPIK